MKKISNEELKTINGGLTACLTLYDLFFLKLPSGGAVRRYNRC